MRVLDTREYVSTLRELTEQGREVSMVIAGNSMSPFLVHGRDSITFRKPDRPLKTGDMVFYQRDSGQFVMHRIHRVRPEGYDIVGDAQREIEGPVRADQIFAVVTKVKRKGQWLEPGDFWWDFFARVWIRMVPLRGTALRLYGAVHRTGQEKTGE